MGEIAQRSAVYRQTTQVFGLRWPNGIFVIAQGGREDQTPIKCVRPRPLLQYGLTDVCGALPFESVQFKCVRIEGTRVQFENLRLARFNLTRHISSAFDLRPLSAYNFNSFNLSANDWSAFGANNLRPFKCRGTVSTPKTCADTLTSTLAGFRASGCPFETFRFFCLFTLS